METTRTQEQLDAVAFAGQTLGPFFSQTPSRALQADCTEPSPNSTSRPARPNGPSRRKETRSRRCSR